MASKRGGIRRSVSNAKVRAARADQLGQLRAKEDTPTGKPNAFAQAVNLAVEPKPKRKANAKPKVPPGESF